jgi:hypothetical protein
VTNGAALGWLPYAFPILFLGTWVLASMVLGFVSGWFNLQQWYPDEGGEEPLLTLNGQSGSMGAGTWFKGVLRLSSYPSGLGVGVWRIFAPFQRPLKIPWSEIEAEPSSSFFLPMVKLNLGKPANGRLKISARSWSRLIGAVPNEARQFQMTAFPVTAGSFARALIIQWVAMAAIVSAFLAFASVTTGPSARFPPVLLIGFFLLFFGIAQLIRYAREG